MKKFKSDGTVYDVGEKTVLKIEKLSCQVCLGVFDKLIHNTTKGSVCITCFMKLIAKDGV